MGDRVLQKKQLCLGGTVETYPWQWQGQTVTMTYEVLGDGEPVLLLPAFSTVSTRAELQTLAERLATQFQTVVLDWPGFGESDRLPLDYGPDLYARCLSDVVGALFAEPVAIVAAGHAAGYALKLAADRPNVCTKLVLVAPTWRGPLVAMGLPAVVRAGIKDLVRSPVIGRSLYGLNTQPGFLKWMYRRHVFTNDALLTAEYVERRHRMTQHANGRYAPAAFVTGGLDPVQTREALLKDFDRATCPVLVVVAEQAPPASKAEMEAMVAAKKVQSARLPGTLGLAEEYGAKVAEVVLPFLTMVPD